MAKVTTLLKGYNAFYRKYFASGDPLYRRLAKVGQSPKTLVIACCDSRVDPSIIMDSRPGDIFVVRNVANLVPPYQIDDNGLHGVSASLEFAVRILKVKHIVILGHSSCAGIRTLLNSNDVKDTDFIGRWVNIAKAAKDKAVAANPDAAQSVLCTACEKESIRLSLDNLMTFPWIKSTVQKNQLELHGWYLSLQDGLLQEYNQQTAEFEQIPIALNAM